MYRTEGRKTSRKKSEEGECRRLKVEWLHSLAPYFEREAKATKLVGLISIVGWVRNNRRCL